MIRQLSFPPEMFWRILCSRQPGLAPEGHETTLASKAVMAHSAPEPFGAASLPSYSSRGTPTWPQVQLYSLGAHLGGGGPPRALVAEGPVLQDGDAASGGLDVVLPAAVVKEVGM